MKNKKIIKNQERLMIREIYEQPEVFTSLIKKHIELKTFQVNFEDLSKIKSFKRIIFLACGSSYHAGLYGKYVFEELGNIKAECEYAHEFVSRDVVLENDTLVIAISQSGETGSVIEAVKKAKKKKAIVLGISNNDKSKLKKISNYFIHTDAGEEKSMAATKSFTSELFTIYLLSLYFGNFNKINPKFREQVLKEVLLLPKKMKKILDTENDILKIAQKIYKENKIIFLGRKYGFIVAVESALKFRETTYMNSIGFSSEEFRHGSIAILEKNFPCIVFIPGNNIAKEDLNLIDELSRDGANVIAISNLTNTKLQQKPKYLLSIPKTSEALYPFLLIIVIQILSFQMAGLKKINVDKSRNIIKYIP